MRGKKRKEDQHMRIDPDYYSNIDAAIIKR